MSARKSRIGWMAVISGCCAATYGGPALGCAVVFGLLTVAMAVLSVEDVEFRLTIVA